MAAVALQTTMRKRMTTKINNDTCRNFGCIDDYKMRDPSIVFKKAFGLIFRTKVSQTVLTLRNSTDMYKISLLFFWSNSANLLCLSKKTCVDKLSGGRLIRNFEFFYLRVTNRNDCLCAPLLSKRTLCARRRRWAAIAM